MSDPAGDEKLARAAEVLAQAEAAAAVRPSRPSSAVARGGSAPSDGAPVLPRGAPVLPRGAPVLPRGAPAHPPSNPAQGLPDADPDSVAREIVLRQLAMAPRSRAQLERKLAQRGCEPDVAARVLDRMADVGLVDDEAYAELLVRSKHGTQGLARQGLRHELRKRGIDREVADEALCALGADAERAKAEELVAKKLRTLAGLPPDVQARRLAGMLARKGYPGEIAWQVVRDAVNGAPEHGRD